MRYMYGNGLYILDIFDYYIQNVLMLVLGLVEVLLLLYAGNKFRKFIVKHSDILKNKAYYLIAWIFAGLVLLGLI